VPAPTVTAEDAFELSERELEVARLVASGLSNPAIASALFISVATVKTHVSHILAKLSLDSRAAGELGRGPRPRPACASPRVEARRRRIITAIGGRPTAGGLGAEGDGTRTGGRGRERTKEARLCAGG
jgi:DNA-binding CsgD family transcriptional regulator